MLEIQNVSSIRSNKPVVGEWNSVKIPTDISLDNEKINFELGYL